MARNDCPFCEGRKVFLLASTNIKLDCNFCNARGEITRPTNFDTAKERPGLTTRISNFFSSNNKVNEND